MLIVTFFCSLPSWATIAVVNSYNPTAFPATITSTTSGNAILVFSDNTVNPASVQFSGGSSFTLDECIPTTAISNICVWYATNIASGKTSITCTTCGTTNAAHIYEISGYDATTFIADRAACYAFNVVCNSAALALPFTPGYSAEGIFYAGNCTSSASSMNSGWTAAFPHGEPGAYQIVSSTATVTAAPNSGCGGSAGIIIGVKQSGATQSCTANISYFDYGVAAGSSGNPTAAATLLRTGDIVTVTVWGINGITVSGVTVGTDTATQLVAGVSDANNGQPFIYADLNSAVSGAQTITATISGTRTQSQVTYREWVPTTGCTPSLDVTVNTGNTGTGTAVNNPSITPTAGDLVLNFTPVESHTTAVNSPWLCDQYSGSGETANCFFVTTVNAFPYIRSSAGSSTANNLTQLNSSPWQGIMAAIKFAGSGGATTLPQIFVLRP
jgi:hypothetical protein